MTNRMIVRPNSSFFILLAGFFCGSLLTDSRAATSSLDNGTVRITVDLNQGGGIVAFHPTGQTNNSVINTYDRGRNCQQSYYSGPSQFLPAGTTQNPNWNPWPWNPVQGGDCYNNGSGTISWSNNGTTLYVKSRPKQWALKNYDADCIFEQWITLNGSVATVQNRLINSRSDTTQYQAMDQELGALYTWRALSQLWTYTGTQPFTGGALTQIPKTAPPWAYFRATEGWAAYTMSSGSKWGVGILVRGNCSFIGGFSGSTTSGTQSSVNTGYIAPLRREVIDHNIVHDFTYQLILGNLADIRNYAVGQQANLKPNFFFRGTRAGWTYQVASDSGYPVPADHLRVNVNTGDPQMWGPECSFQAAEVPKLYIRAAVYCFAGTPTTAQLFWEKENGSSPMSEAQSHSFPLINDGQYHMYTIDLSKHASWTGQISRLRFDPVYNGTTGDYVKVSAITSTAPGVMVAEDGGSTAVTEGGATDTYSAVLTSEPTGNVTITPAPGSQLTVSPASLTFTVSDWNIPQTVTIAAIDDAVAQGTRIQTVTHAARSADPGYNGLAVASVNVTITDNVSSFNEWTGGGTVMTPQLLEKYAVGGAASSTGFIEQSAAGFSGPNFTLTAIVRTNDPLLTVVGQSSTDLMTWTNLATNSFGTPSASQAGVPYGCDRRDFTIPVDLDVRRFLNPMGRRICHSTPSLRASDPQYRRTRYLLFQWPVRITWTRSKASSRGSVPRITLSVARVLPGACCPKPGPLLPRCRAFHLNEKLADKLSSGLCFVPELLLHLNAQRCGPCGRSFDGSYDKSIAIFRWRECTLML